MVKRTLLWMVTTRALNQVVLVLGPFLLVNAQDNLVPIDLNAWTAESYPAVSGFGSGVWMVSPDLLSVLQTVNGQPTFFYSDFLAFDNKVEGKIMVEGGGDNDYIGFAMGFQPEDTSNADADYLLIDWKQGTQNFNFGSPSGTPGSTAARGLAVSRVFGVPTADELWGHINFDHPTSDLDNGLEELARGLTLGDTGWERNREYLFAFELSATSFRVFVDDALEINLTGNFIDGRVAFYNFSQANVKYSSFARPFRITEIVENEGDSIQLTWNSWLGGDYVVWSNPDLVNGEWVDEASVASQGTSTSWTDTPSPSTAPKFYRIERK